MLGCLLSHGLCGQETGNGGTGLIKGWPCRAQSYRNLYGDLRARESRTRPCRSQDSLQGWRAMDAPSGYPGVFTGGAGGATERVDMGPQP